VKAIDGMEPEPRDTRLRRLRMRSWRRGIKEMDLILGSFSERKMEALSPEWLDLYDVLLSENDQDLYAWVTGQTAAPAPFAELIAEIARHADDLLPP
jgi:antitoxin CptB